MTHLFLRPMIGALTRTRTRRAAALAGIYAVVFSLCLWLAYQVRFDFDVPARFTANLLPVAVLAVGAKLLFMRWFHQFDGLLTYFSFPDLRRLGGACLAGSLPLALVWATHGVQVAPPLGVIFNDLALSAIALGTLRFSFRHLRRVEHHQRLKRHARRVGIVGAGDAGASLARDLLAKPWLALRPSAFFDDWRQRPSSVHGIPVVGRPEQFGELRHRFQLDEVIVAMPSASARRVREVFALARQAGLPCRTVPSLDQLTTGQVSADRVRPVKLADLLGRPPVEIDTEAVRNILTGKTVLVTGAGGSIGSELCRQILSFGPKCLLLVERAEPPLFVIEQELLTGPNAAAVVPLVCDVTQRGALGDIFRRFQPEIVFHAAAHKHVPMMEAQPEEAICNNVFGTAQVAELAIEHEVERFVFVSTDKAVNPTSVMGATKRLAEIYLQSLNHGGHGTEFIAVRFGNVLGSSGSVVPTFSRQIAAGGPVTITHPEVTRFFMTIPEAVTLVLEGAAIGDGGNILVLDMGQPIRILDLAFKMISLSGLRPNEDIEVSFVGLRPGEKLHEELSHSREQIATTKHPKIMRLVSPGRDHAEVQPSLDELASKLRGGGLERDEMRSLLFRAIAEPALVPQPSSHRPFPRGGLPAMHPARFAGSH